VLAAAAWPQHLPHLINPMKVGAAETPSGGKGGGSKADARRHELLWLRPADVQSGFMCRMHWPGVMCGMHRQPVNMYD
jgi:hypothetical protein